MICKLFPYSLNKTKPNVFSYNCRLDCNKLPDINVNKNNNCLVNVKIYKKNFINQDIFLKVSENEKPDKILDFIDYYYIRYINKTKNKKVEFQENIIKKYNSKNNNQTFKKNMRYFVNIPDSDLVVDEVYLKYYEIGKEINLNGNVNKTMILKYFNAKNISMIKNRCDRIYKVITHMKQNKIRYITSSIRNIFHIKNHEFVKGLAGNLFFSI
jgi:ribosomal protein L21E